MEVFTKQKLNTFKLVISALKKAKGLEPLV